MGAYAADRQWVTSSGGPKWHVASFCRIGTMDLSVLTLSRFQFALSIMATIAALGMPFVLSYTSVVYWVFRGKVQLSQLSY